MRFSKITHTLILLVGAQIVEAQTVCVPDLLNTKIRSVSVTDFDCNKNILGDGFKDCEAIIDVLVTTQCTEETFDVLATCRAELKYKKEDALFGQTDSKLLSESVWMNKGSGSQSFRFKWKPTAILTTIVEARLGDANCGLDHVYDY